MLNLNKIFRACGKWRGALFVAMAWPAMAPASAQETRAIPLCVNDKCAVVNERGAVVMPFDNPFDNVIAANGKSTVFVAHDQIWHLVSADGKQMVKANLTEDLISLTPGYFGIGRNGKFGVVDGDGKEVQPPRFDAVYTGGEDEFIIYEVGDQLGLLSNTGKTITKARFTSIASSTSAAKNGMWVTASDKEGQGWAIHLDTMQVRPATYASLQTMSDGHMVAKTADGKQSGLVNKNGDAVIALKYYALGNPSAGLVSFSKGYNEPCGYMDYKGKVVIAPKFSTCLPFGTNEAMARERLADGSQGKFGPIDRKGQWKASPSYDYATLAGHTAFGFTRHVSGLLVVTKMTGPFQGVSGLYSTDEGREILPPTYQLVGAIDATRFVFSEAGSPTVNVKFLGSESPMPAVGVMGRDWKPLIVPSAAISFRMDPSGRFFESLDGISKEAKAGLFDLNGKPVVAPLWQRLNVDVPANLIKGYTVVADDTEQGSETLSALYDLDGKALLTVEKTACGAEQLRNSEGDIIWPKRPDDYCPPSS